MYAQSLSRLLSILDELRERCPWDKKQTLQSLRPQTIEELYELTDALSGERWDDIREELGDILLHIVFYCRIASEQGQFAMPDVIEGICNKLIHRHPHIYSVISVNDEADVRRNWEQIKKSEGKQSVLSGVPASMPALIKALRIQEKSAQIGFEWKRIAEVREKVAEELREMDEAVASGNQEHIEEEIGDLFFAMINYARFAGVDPEEALEKTNRKFIRRFRYIEEAADRMGKDIRSMDLAEMDALWNEAKRSDK
ncbi:MAG: nucleoside triphosphate pyrophosphohydrolase [Chitinophagaceae bacterium]